MRGKKIETFRDILNYFYKNHRAVSAPLHSRLESNQAVFYGSWIQIQKNGTIDEFELLKSLVNNSNRTDNGLHLCRIFVFGLKHIVSMPFMAPGPIFISDFSSQVEARTPLKNIKKYLES